MVAISPSAWRRTDRPGRWDLGDMMDGLLWFIIGLLIGWPIGLLIVCTGIGKITIFRLFNRIHRYLIVPLFRRKWDYIDQMWYGEWEQKKQGL